MNYNKLYGIIFDQKYLKSNWLKKKYGGIDDHTKLGRGPIVTHRAIFHPSCILPSNYILWSTVIKFAWLSITAQHKLVAFLVKLLPATHRAQFHKEPASCWRHSLWHCALPQCGTRNRLLAIYSNGKGGAIIPFFIFEWLWPFLKHN